MTELLILSVILQFAAALLALRLFFLTHRKIAWLLISTGLLLMGIRRLVTLSQTLSTEVRSPPDLAAESIALVISILMLAGIYWIGPLFLALKKSEEDSRQEASELRSTYESFPDLIFRLAPDGTVLKYHALDEGDLYIPPEEFLGKRPTEFLPKEVADQLETSIRELEEGIPESTYEYELPSSKGKLHFEARVSRLPNNDLRVIARNITQRRRIQEELQESERRFATLFDGSPLPAMRFRPDGSLISFNQASMDLWGLSLEAKQFLERNYNLLRDEELERRGLLSFVQRAFQGETVLIPPVYLQPKVLPGMPYEGEPPGRWVQTLLSPVKDVGGRLVEVLVSQEDLTHRLETQRAFLESEERYKAIFENAAVGVALAATHGGGFITANRKFCEIFGISQEEALGMTMRDFTPHEDLAKDFEAVVNVLQRRETTRFRSEKRYFRKDGSPIWADIGLSFIWGDKEEKDVHVIVVEDVTARKTAEILQKESEERYRATFENAAVGVALCDTSTGRVIQANEKFCEILGISLDEAPGTTMLQFTHPEDIKADLRVAYDVIRERKTELLHTEKRYVRKDGSTFWASFAISLIWGKGGEPDRHIIVLEDITHRVEAELALRDREAKYRAIYDNAAMGVALLDNRSGRILQANHRFCRIFGMELHEVQGRPLLEFARADLKADDPQSKPTYNEKRDAQFLEKEQAFVRKDGSVGWAEYSASYIWGGDGEPDLHILIVNDVTDRKNAEIALQESEEKHRLLVESTNVVFWEADPETWNLRYISPQAEKILGYPTSAWFQKDFWADHLHPEDREHAVRQCMEGMSSLQDHSYEYRMIAADGATIWIRDNVSVLLEADKPVLFRGVMVDVTKTKHAEEERARLGIAIEQAGELVFITDDQHRIQYVNPSFTHVTGYSATEVDGRKSHDIVLNPHRDPVLSRAFSAALERGETWRGQVGATRKAGDPALLDLAVSPVRDGSGRLVNYVFIGRDITRETELETMLRQAQKMEAVGQLAGGIAHDFNNILQAIQGYTDITRQDLPPGSETRANLDEVSRASQRASTLVRQLLTFSRRDRREPKILDLNETIGGLIKMLRRVIGEQIDLNLHLVPKLKLIYADPGQIEQILMNLCVNARDAMPEGGSISIETENAVFDEDFSETFAWARGGDYIRLRVSDTGSGIPAEYLDRIFEPFFTTKEVGKGTGLGLATVYGIVKQHEGHIDVHSEPKKGTVFTIYFPAENRSVEQDFLQAPQRDAAPGGGETILLAEDDTLVRQLAVQIFERAGYTVLVARDGEEAIDLFHRHASRIDLAVLDMVMPKRTGKAVYEKIREMRAELPVLFSSGYSFGTLDGEPDVGEGFDRIQKPFDPGALLAKARELLDRAKSAPV